MIIPNLWNNRKCSKPSTSYGFKLFKTSCWPIEIATLGYPMWFGQIQRSFVVFIRSFRKSEWWIDHDSPHVRCQYRIPIIAVAKITILVAWYPLPLASEECLYLEFGISPLLLAEILKKRGQTRVQTTCINMSWLTAITIYIHKNGQSICGFWRPSIWIYGRKSNAIINHPSNCLGVILHHPK